MVLRDSTWRHVSAHSRVPTHDSCVAIRPNGLAPKRERGGSPPRGPLRAHGRDWNPSPQDFVRLLEMAFGRRMIDWMRAVPRAVEVVPQRCGAATSTVWGTRLPHEWAVVEGQLPSR